MSLSKRPALKLESLNDRIVPATLNLTTTGAQGTLNGAMFSQLSPGAVDPSTTNTFVSLHERTILGSIFTAEEGYNTDARPLQFDAIGNASTARSLLLMDIPMVSQNGNNYYEFLLTVNQPQRAANIDLQELRIFLSSSSNLTGYNTNTDRLAGLLPSFNLDGNGNNTVRINDNLNRTSSPDVRVLIPASAFNGADPNTTYVYLYSKFSALIGTTYLSGAESWSVGTPAPTTTLGSLSGRVVDTSGNGLGGITITLSGNDVNGESFVFGIDEDGNPITDWAITTDNTGTYSFSDLTAGTYNININNQQPYVSVDSTAGNTSDPATFAGYDYYVDTNGDVNGDPNAILGIEMSAGETGTNFNFLMGIDNT